MTKRRAIALAATLAGLLGSAGAHAEGDPEKGRYAAQTCLGCHGVDDYANVYPTYKVPKLGGQHAEYIVSALEAYRSGDRPHPTMQAQARALTEQEIEDIAAYFASIDQSR
ncbi:MAG: c-type cytochrome [Halofilum sp. (in: g-proteobacteria)]